MGNEANPQSVNTIVAEALAKAGVPPRNIELPETEKGEPLPNPYSNGKPKGSVQGAETEPETPESEAQESEPAETSEPESGKKPEQLLGKADIETAISQASSRFQSLMDRKINQLQDQMTQTINALNQFFQSQEDAGLNGLPKEEQLERRLARLEKGGTQPRIPVQQPIERQPVQFYQYLANFVDAVGLKIDDTRIDWAKDTNDPQVGFNRFLGSIKKVLVEDQTKTIEALKTEGNKEIQKIRKKSGIDKVSTSGPSGTGLPNIDKMTPLQKLEYAFQQNEQAGK